MKNSINFNDFLLIPNIITLIRVFILPISIYSLSLSNFLPSIIIIGISVISDIIDGPISRKLSQVTNLGKFLDPIADKICIIGIGIGLVIYKDFPLWLLIFFIIRDIAIFLGGLFLFFSKKVLVVSNFIGKLSTIFFFLLVLTYLIKEFITPFILTIAIYSSFIVTLFSTLIYIIRFFEKLKIKN